MLHPTHKSIGGGYKVAAWHYTKRNSVPLWIVRNFHDLGDGHLSHRSGVKVNENDWIVAQELEPKTCVVLTDQEFKMLFKEL